MSGDFDLSKLLEDLIPDPGKRITCWHCHWEGTRREAICSEVCTPPSTWAMLCGREGWEWSCPRCHYMIDSFYTRMS